MSNLVYAEVPVGKTSILSFRDGDTVYVPLRNLCDKLGIPWPNEFRKIQNDPILSKAVIKLITALSNGQPQLCLPMNYVPGWLFKLNINTVADEAKEHLTAIQHEGYDALYAYWVKGAAINPRMAGSVASAAVGDVLRLIDAVKAERDPVALAVKHALLTQVLEQRNLPVPAIDAFNQPGPDDHEAEALLAQIDAMIEAGTLTNLHRVQDAFIAVRRKDLEALGIVFRPALRDALVRHGRYKRYGSVSIKGGKSAHCWVFTRA